MENKQTVASRVVRYPGISEVFSTIYSPFIRHYILINGK